MAATKSLTIGGLRAKLLIVVFIAVLPALGVILYNTASSRQLAISEAEKSALEWVHVISNYQRDLDRQTRTMVELLARDPIVLGTDHEACNRRFADLLFNAVNQPENFFNFVAIDLNGDIYCAARKGEPENMHVRDREYFWQVRTMEKPVTGGYVFGKIIRAPIVPFAGPIFDARHQLSGVMLVTVNLSWLSKTIAPRLPKGAILSLYDSNGTILVHSPDQSAMVGKKDALFSKLLTGNDDGVFSSRDAGDGIERLNAFARIPYGEHNFYVVVSIPRGEAYANADATLTRGLFILSAAICAILLAAWWIGNSLILDSIDHLMAAVLDMTAGRLSARVSLRRRDEIGLLGQAFNKMGGVLETAVSEAERLKSEAEVRSHQLELVNQAKSRFLAAASHDLRQPMHALNLYLGALTLHQLPPSALPVLANVRLCAETMDEMFRALLDISQLDASIVQAEISIFPIEQLLERVRMEFLPAAQAKGLALHVAPCSAFIKSDPVLLSRILSNLMANAVRYTEHGKILVGCRRKGNKLQLAVYDTGPGIAAGHQAEVFEEFYQVGNPERDRRQGLGLGLAIVKRLAVLLDTHIKLISRPGHGAMFALDLPLVHAENPVLDHSMRAGSKEGQLAGALVAVVDDEPVILNATRTLLEQWGCTVIAATSGSSAIEQLSLCSQVPDALLCDYRLRGNETGIDVINAIRKEYNENIPAMLISGDTGPQRVKEIQASGLTVLHKPVLDHILQAALSKLVNGKQEISGA
jgi:signal transduction histidine kinase/ActR/RegA family two-component response regulator